MADPGEARKYVEVAGAAGGFSLRPSGPGPELPESPILSDIGSLWDPARFAVARAPLVVGRVEDRRRFSSPIPARVSNVPVKLPGSEYRFPAETESVREALQLMIDCEHAVNPAVDEYYAYLTVDQDVIGEGQSQRGTDVHAEPLQGTRIDPKRAADHGYVCTDRDPPRFFGQAFHLSAADVAADAYNDAFAAQARLESAVRAAPYEVVLFDAYSVHGAVPAAATARRTFIRCLYSTGVFAYPSDTRNALFETVDAIVTDPAIA
jgi:hypothetical protein